MMKKISLMIATAAIVAGGMLNASCASSDNDSSKEVVVKEVTVDNVKTIQLTSNVETKFTLGNVVKTGKVVEFEFDGEKATIKAELEGYIPQTATIVFSKGQNAAALDFNMVKASSNLVAQADAKGKIVTNDLSNQTTLGIVGGIDVPADVIITGNTKDPFSFAVFNPAPEVISLDDVASGDKEEASIFAFDCNPDGAQFDKPITVSLVIPGIEGFDLDFPGAKDFVVNGENVSFKVEHFSKYNLRVAAKVARIQKGTKQIFNRTLPATGGTLSNSFSENVGFEGTSPLSNIWRLVAQNLFGGSKREVKKQFGVKFDGTGSVNLLIEQSYEDVTLTSGTQTATIRVWRDITATAKGMSDQGHGGGTTTPSGN